MSESTFEGKTTNKIPTNIDEFIEAVKSDYTQNDIQLIKSAYDFSKAAHEGQVRRSGEPYIQHPLSVAYILAELKLDISTIITGLLHDTVEDTDITLQDIEDTFGKTTSHLVDGITKITQMKFSNTHEKQGENIRKMIVAMGKDVRVILVKLADRLHNMRTLNHMPYQKQARIAQETFDIYAPLASRLGINSIKIELEDLSFRYAYPDMYYELAQKVAKKKKEREKYIDDVRRTITQEFGSRSDVNFEVQGRPKHLYSIYKKMKMQSIDYEQVFDVLAFRVIVNSIPSCYEILGLVHSLWKPIPGRFKDFIAMPKANNYQSLHTTVIGPGAERIEIQIRTEEMHIIAEKGIAAHWSYKEGDAAGASANDEIIQKYNWLRELISLHQQTQSSDEFLENIKTDLFETEIYVFTPKGDVKEFPEGATPIDFAFSVHTDVGHHIVAARVNGKLVALKYQLQNGDSIEVITSKNQTPSKDWLNYSVTSKARSKIRAFVKKEQRERAYALGKELVEKTFRKSGGSTNRFFKGHEFEKFLKDNGCSTESDVYIKVGYGKLMPKTILEFFMSKEEQSNKTNEGNIFERVINSTFKKKKKSTSLIDVDGMSDVLVRFAKCCSPIPGDPILGFITLGRGIVIHRADCAKSFEFDSDRKVGVEWTGQEGSGRHVKVRVTSYDTHGLLKDMTEVFIAHGVSIHNAQIRTTKDKKAVCIFDVSVKDANHLDKTMMSLKKIKGIIGVSRITRG